MKRVSILAVASAGGHWVQLRSIRPAFKNAEVLWVSTTRGYAQEMDLGERFAVVLDANRWQKFRLLLSLMQLLFILIRFRPQRVITTGAAPGYFAIRLGKLFGAKTMWIDSFANSEELSLSGQLAKKHSDAVLTQWEHLADGVQVVHRGAVL